MAGLISNTELTNQLEQLIPHCKNLTIISAYITQPATSWLRDLICENSPNVQLVGRFTPNDFANGASNFDALRDCLNNGYRVSALSNLHAKIYQIDFETIFNGSANLTGKGLALVSNGNLESCSKVEASFESKAFISKIVDSSTELTVSILDRMEKYLLEFEGGDVKDIPVLWPEDILSPSTDLFVSDFPVGKPGAYVNEYQLNPSLPFAQIDLAADNFSLAATLFKKCKAYLWLKTQIKDNQNSRDLGFGQVSQLLHDALTDDPAPYRLDVKFLLSNLYEFIKIYAADEVEIFVPGTKSQVIKLKKRA